MEQSVFYSTPVKVQYDILYNGIRDNLSRGSTPLGISLKNDDYLFLRFRLRKGIAVSNKCSMVAHNTFILYDIWMSRKISTPTG